MALPIEFQAYTVKEFFFGDLKEFPTALTVEQLPLVKSHVEKLSESIYDAGKLYKLPLVVGFNDTRYLAGGRNRLAALDELGMVDEDTVPCLYTEASSSKELIALIIGDNSSRRSNAAERKTLTVLGEYGIGMSYDDISNTITNLASDDLTKETRVEIAKLFKLMMAHAITELSSGEDLANNPTLDVLTNPNTALALANTMWSKFSQIKHTYVIPETFDTDGTKMTAAKRVNIKLVDYLLDNGMVSQIDDIVHAMSNVLTDIELPSDTQRKAASVVKTNWELFKLAIDSNL